MSEEPAPAAGVEETTTQLQPYTDWSSQQPQIVEATPVMQEAVSAPAPVASEPAPSPVAPEVAAQQVVEETAEDVSDNNGQVIIESVPDVEDVNPKVEEKEVKNGEKKEQSAEKEDAPAEQPAASVSSAKTNGTVGETGYKKNLRRRSEKVVYIKPESDDEDDTVELKFSEFNQHPKRRVKRGRRGRKPANLRADPKKTERLIMESPGSSKSPNKSPGGIKPNYNSPRYTYRGLRGHYNSYTQIERLEIGRQALMNGHMATAKKFNVHESTVRDFRMKLEKHVASGKLSLTVPFEEQEIPALGKRGRPMKPKMPKPPRPRDEHGKIRRGHYKVYTQKERLEIGRHAVIHGSGATIKKYNIHESTVRDFRKKLEVFVEAGVVSLTVPLEEQVLPPIGRRGRKRDPTKIRPPKDGKRRRRRKKKEIQAVNENQELTMADVALRQMQNSSWPPQWPAQFQPPPGHHMPPTSHPVETLQMLAPPHNQLQTQLPLPGHLPPHLAQSHQMIPPVSSHQQQIPHPGGPFLEFLGLPPPQPQQHITPHPTPSATPQPPPPQPTPPPQSPHPSIASLPMSPGPSTGRSSIPPPPIASPPPRSNSPELSIDRNFVAETLQTDNLGSLTLANRSRKSLDKAILTILQAKRRRNRTKNLKMIQPETNKRKQEMNSCKVSLGTTDTHKRWMMLKDDLGFESHEELAMHLMDLHAALCMPACNKFGEEVDRHYPPIEPKPKEVPPTPEQICQKEKQKERQMKVQKQRQILRQQLIQQEALQKRIIEKMGVQVEPEPPQVDVAHAVSNEVQQANIQQQHQQLQEHQQQQLQEQQQQFDAAQQQLRHQEQIRQQQEQFQQQEQLRQQEELRQQELRQQEELRRQEELRHQEELQHQEELRHQDEIRRQEELRRQEQIQRQQQQVVAQMVISEQAHSPFPVTSQPHITSREEHQPINLQLHVQEQQVQEHQAQLHIQSTTAAHQVYTTTIGQEEQQTQGHISISSHPPFTSTVQIQQPPLMATRQTPLIQHPRQDQPPLIQHPRQDQPPLIIHTQPILVARAEQQATLMSPMSPRPQEQVPYTVESQESQPHIATIARHAVQPFPVGLNVTHVTAIPLERQEQPQYVLSASPHPQEPVRYVPAPPPDQQQQQQQQQPPQQQQQVQQPPQQQQPQQQPPQQPQQQQYPVTSQDQQVYSNNV